MSLKIAKTKLVSVNGMPVIAPRGFTTADIKKWFEDTEDSEAFDVLPLPLHGRAERGEPTYAEQIEKTDFDPETDLPMFL